MDISDAGPRAASFGAAGLRGIHSRSILRVPEYVEKLTRSGVDPRGRPSAMSRAAER
jgi:LDH2 family malate/lactate/ureidoglycolate dehydrogenase